MPSLARRRETDLRVGRFESEMRSSDLARVQADGPGKAPIYQCKGCGRVFEERSRNCPRCDKRTMGELRPIPGRHLEQAQARSLARLRAKHS